MASWSVRPDIGIGGVGGSHRGASTGPDPQDPRQPRESPLDGRSPPTVRATGGVARASFSKVVIGTRTG